MEKKAKIFIAGHTGLVGSAIERRLKAGGYDNLCLISHKALDLRNQAAVNEFFKREKPDYVFMSAATVGGVLANNIRPTEFIYDNLAISLHVIHAAYQNDVKKLLYMGSNCIYPRMAPQPIREESLLTGLLEPTNEAYAIAKIAGLKLCEYYKKQYGADFITCMPCNAYGPGDNYAEEASHVVAALIRRVICAKENGENSIIMWGTGNPLREFIYIDDLADACVFLMERYSGTECINIGTGMAYTIQELTEAVCKGAGYEGKIVNDLSKPDGVPKKLLDSSHLFSLGWKPQIGFEEGIQRTLRDFQKNRLHYLEE